MELFMAGFLSVTKFTVITIRVGGAFSADICRFITMRAMAWRIARNTLSVLRVTGLCPVAKRTVVTLRVGFASSGFNCTQTTSPAPAAIFILRLLNALAAVFDTAALNAAVTVHQAHIFTGFLFNLAAITIFSGGNTFLVAAAGGLSTNT